MVLGGPEGPLPPEVARTEVSDEALLDAVATRVVRMGLATPAVFFLESTKPLSYVGSQALVFLEPFVKTFLTLNNYQRFVALLEDRRNIERLMVRIEELDEEVRREEKKRKAEARAAKAALSTEPKDRRNALRRLFGARRRPDGKGTHGIG